MRNYSRKQNSNVKYPEMKSFISPAFEHEKMTNMFGDINKEGNIRVLEPYQVRTLDEYIDIDNLNQEFIQTTSFSGKSNAVSNISTAEDQDRIMKIIALQSNIYNNRFNIRSNFEDFNKFSNGRLYPETSQKLKRDKELIIMKRLNIKSFGNQTQRVHSTHRPHRMHFLS